MSLEDDDFDIEYSDQTVTFEGRIAVTGAELEESEGDIKAALEAILSGVQCTVIEILEE